MTATEIDEACITLHIPDSVCYVDIEDPGDYLINTSGEVVAYRNLNPGEEGIVIGLFQVITVDVEGAQLGGFDAFDVFDLEQKTYDYMDALYNLRSTNTSAARFKEKIINMIPYVTHRIGPNLLILDRLEIYPQYRGRDFGNQVLKTLIKRFSVGNNLIALSAYPLQFEASSDRLPEDMDKEEIAQAEKRSRLELDKFKDSRKVSFKKLETHYAQLGFQRIKGTDYMIKAK